VCSIFKLHCASLFYCDIFFPLTLVSSAIKSSLEISLPWLSSFFIRLQINHHQEAREHTHACPKRHVLSRSLPAPRTRATVSTIRTSSMTSFGSYPEHSSCRWTSLSRLGPLNVWFLDRRDGSLENKQDLKLELFSIVCSQFVKSFFQLTRDRTKTKRAYIFVFLSVWGHHVRTHHGHVCTEKSSPWPSGVWKGGSCVMWWSNTCTSCLL